MLSNEQIAAACFNYGYLALIYLMHQLASEERYEECQAIKNGLEHVKAKHDIDYELSLSEDNIAQYKANMLIFARITDCTTSLINMPRYADMARGYLKIK
jgi:hypothetical protein